MYLKSLEMIGFKSFVDKTTLGFEPGLTAIVGPNGCGKSNISDALRWVLGEQSAKALRGNKMEDVIFNGTDARKPTGMAEVSITFAECEKTLGTEYHEVAVTRRVFRSGEGQYFLNRTPCRLKDIQRLFMDTGIGTDSYSVMEQGRIDQVLSAHPDDRRAIFEEASGVTRFKADKKEALRKLEQTELNLVRLADVIREVKRQIGSLQRQAGKARRYQEIQTELRKLDLYATRQRVAAAAAAIEKLEAEIAALTDKAGSAHGEVAELERGATVLRESLVATEREIGSMLEAGSRARNQLDHARELIQVNSLRIAEYLDLCARDSKEIEDTQRLLAGKEDDSVRLAGELAQARTEQERRAEALRASGATLERHREQTEGARSRIQKLRADLLDLESLQMRLQNELVEFESRERSSVIQRERLAAEKGNLARVVAAFAQGESDLAAELAALREGADAQERQSGALEREGEEARTRLRDLERQRADTEAAIAARQAQIDLLSDPREAEADFPTGIRRLLGAVGAVPMAADRVLGALAACLEAEPEYATALEAALRPWLDALVVRDLPSALAILRQLEAAREGAARLLAVEAPAPARGAAPYPAAPGVPLVEHLRCDETVRPLVRRLLGGVRVVETLDDIPAPPPDEWVFVTKDGAIVRGDGRLEFWMRDTRALTPLTRKHALADARRELDALRDALAGAARAAAEIAAQAQTLAAARAQAQGRLDEARRALAQKEGEATVVAREAAAARQRLETVAWELESLASQGADGESQRQAIVARTNELQSERQQGTARVHELTVELHDRERRQSDLQVEVTEDRVRLSNVALRVQHLEQQHGELQGRIAEMKATIAGRAAGVETCQATMAKLRSAMDAAEGQLASLEEAVKDNHLQAESLKRNRERQSQELKETERVLAERRAALEGLRETKAALDLRAAEARMRRQNQIDRVGADYHVGLDQVMAEPDPQWEGATPSLEAVETLVAELRAKLEGMGPVNLVAIEEYRELEERYAFLTGQEQDLVNSKQQLMEMIRTINRTTSEMFRSTFEQVNVNFQAMFARMFNGGTARLVLANEEEVLECGIEIIARPPGKRLQNVTLLSGGERTLTAVALLFAIYLIKPSPFCLLDELDAALDETNIGRFAAILKDFLLQSQFVVITHNRQMIAAADILYGVTMPEKGVSKIVSMRFMDRQPAGEPPAPSSAPAAARPETALPAGAAGGAAT